MNTQLWAQISHPQTLLAFLRDHLPEYPSVKAIKRAIEAKQCAINGRVETFSTHLVQFGDRIEINLQIDIPQFPITPLFEDEEMIFFNKPPGRTSENLSRYFLVHRLDKETSGVILFAKTLSMQQALIDLFRQREIEKSYFAICDGKIKKEKWVVENSLEKKASFQGGSLYGKAHKGKGKRAMTHFCLVQSCETASLIIAKPITGRTHQIRVHLKKMGHPLLGDYQYAKHFTCPVRPLRHMLHAHELQFSHPFTKQKISIVAPLLVDFLDVQKTLFEA